MKDVASSVSYGASPRASLGLIAASRALALLRGRDYVLPQDLLDVAAGCAAAPARAQVRSGGRRRPRRPHRQADRADGAAAPGRAAAAGRRFRAQRSPAARRCPPTCAAGLGRRVRSSCRRATPGRSSATVAAAGAGTRGPRPGRARGARQRARPAAGVIRRRRAPEPAVAGPSSGSAHPGLLLHPATPGSGVDAETRGDGAPPRFTDGPADALLRRLELTVRRRLDGLLQGDHLGLVPGIGSEAGDSRTYHPGDDVRRMDWPVTARTQVPHVRETIADRELETWAVVDLSASLDFGTALCQKRDLAIAGARGRRPI